MVQFLLYFSIFHIYLTISNVLLPPILNTAQLNHFTQLYSTSQVLNSLMFQRKSPINYLSFFIPILIKSRKKKKRKIINSTNMDSSELRSKNPLLRRINWKEIGMSQHDLQSTDWADCSREKARFFGFERDLLRSKISILELVVWPSDRW